MWYSLIGNVNKGQKNKSQRCYHPDVAGQGRQRTAGTDGNPSVSSDIHLQHLTAVAAPRPVRDPGQSQAWCGVTRCRTDARGACLHQMTPELGWSSDIGKDRWHGCHSVCLGEGSSLKWAFELDEERVSVCALKAAAVSHAIKERPPMPALTHHRR